MDDIHLSAEDNSGISKSLFYTISESPHASLNCKFPDNIDLNMFTESMPMHAIQRLECEDGRNISPTPEIHPRPIHPYLEHFSAKPTIHNFDSNSNIDSIITSMNHLGFSTSIDQLSADTSRMNAFKNIWKNDQEEDSQQIYNPQSLATTYSVDKLVSQGNIAYSSCNMQQQQRYLNNMLAYKNKLSSNSPYNGNFDSSRAWDENIHRIHSSRSFPSLLNSQHMIKRSNSLQHSDMPHAVLKSRTNLPFPKHLLPYAMNGMKNMAATTEDEDQQRYPSLSLDHDLMPDSPIPSLFNNNNSNWIASLLSRMSHNDRSMNPQVRDQVVPSMLSSNHLLRANSVHQRMELYSRKVFVGGLPPDIDDREITSSFERFGPLVVDWPHKTETRSYFPPKGYCFLLFQEELSVQALMEACIMEDGKLYWHVSSPTIRNKPVQIRPWKLFDADFVMDNIQPVDPRKTIFVGGVPRPLKAAELAHIINRLYGGVCYAGIDVDPELKYPKGAGRVAFSNQHSYIAAISARFVQLQHGEIDKRVEVKPYVLDDQLCDECQGVHNIEKFAPYFCANVTCLQYYCEKCWYVVHSRPGREFHKPLIKEGADRPRVLPFRW